MNLKTEVIEKLIGQIAKRMKEEDIFKKDPELYTVCAMIAIRDGIGPLQSGYPWPAIDTVLERVTFDEDIKEEAVRLLKRKQKEKKVTAR